MPLYEYHCESCDGEFTKRRAIKEADAPVQCPECEGDHVTRKLSLFVALSGNKGEPKQSMSGGGCGCGGACACGGHSMN